MARYAPSIEWYANVALNLVGGYSLIHKFGRNDTVPNGSFAFINLLAFTAWQLSAATTVRVKAGNAEDTFNGDGAREITVQGIDDSFNEVTETIVTAGLSASSVTSTLFWRIHRAWVSSAGVYGAANTAAVIIENGAGGTDLIQIGIGEGQTQFGGFTIPVGHTGLLLSATITVDAGKAADIRMFTRDNIDVTTAPVSSKRLKLYWDGVLGELIYKPQSPSTTINEKSDIWFEAQGGGAGTEVSVDFELLLVDKNREFFR